jgi:hypothetical protein
MSYLGALPETSNRASYIENVELRDENGELIDLTGTQEIVFQIISPTYDNYTRDGYGLGFGGALGAQTLIATLTNGKIAIIQLGVFQVKFTRSEMNTLPAGDYNVGVVIVRDEITTEIIIGTLPVREGVVTVQAGSE